MCSKKDFKRPKKILFSHLSLILGTERAYNFFKKSLGNAENLISRVTILLYSNVQCPFNKNSDKAYKDLGKYGQFKEKSN